MRHAHHIMCMYVYVRYIWRSIAHGRQDPELSGNLPDAKACKASIHHVKCIDADHLSLHTT